jgi:hypothetical protein
MVKASMGKLPEGMMQGAQKKRSEAGEEIWRHRWWAAVQEVNGRLSKLWGEHKPKIKSWVADKGKQLPYMHEDKVGDLDYIGSLAKGYKSAPKQYIRFMPEKFDVDANLDAPPLAIYAISQGAPVDRGSVTSKTIEPLTNFEAAVNNNMLGAAPVKADEPQVDASSIEVHDNKEALSGVASSSKAEPKREAEPEQASGVQAVPGIDKEDRFEVFIRATNVNDMMLGSHVDVDVAHAEVDLNMRLQKIQDGVWWLRGQNMLLAAKLKEALEAIEVVTAEGTIKQHAKNPLDNKTHHYSDDDMIYMEMYLTMYQEEADKEAEAAKKKEAINVPEEEKKASGGEQLDLSLSSASSSLVSLSESWNANVDQSK